MNKITYGIIGVLILSGIGTTILLSQEQINNVYICTTNNITGIFERFSSTMVTAYWTENGTTRQATCTRGKWIKLTEWCSINNINCSQFIKGLPIQKVEETFVTEEGYEILNDKRTNITISKDTIILVNNKTYNIKYEPVVIIRCICDKISGCKIRECVSGGN